MYLPSDILNIYLVNRTVMAKNDIPKNPYNKVKNSKVQVDNFVYAQLQSNKKNFYVFCGKSKKRIYTGSCSKEIKNSYFDGTCVVAICDNKTYIFGPNDMRYPLKNWRKIREF